MHILKGIVSMKTIPSDQQTGASFQVTSFNIGELKKEQVHRKTTYFSSIVRGSKSI